MKQTHQLYTYLAPEVYEWFLAQAYEQDVTVSHCVSYTLTKLFLDKKKFQIPMDMRTKKGMNFFLRLPKAAK
jgi:hypothetical protein